MSGNRYTEEFKIAAVKQVAQGGRPASEVATRLGIRIHNLFAWTKRYGVPEAERKGLRCPVRRDAAPEGRAQARHGGT